jgi:putative membrane protein
MNTAVWILRIVIGIILVWFALKNAQPVKIFGIGEQWWEAPLVVMLLVVFVGGVLIGLLAWVPTVVRQRREIARLKKTAAPAPATMAPPPAIEPPHGI